MATNQSYSLQSPMLCQCCERIIGRIKTPPGTWAGPKPELFQFPHRTDAWTGAHHTEELSFIRSVKQSCYICKSLVGVFPDEDRRRVVSARTFYELSRDGSERWSLRFAIEMPEDGAKPAHWIECHGWFRIMPKIALDPALGKAQHTGSDSSSRCKDQVQKWLDGCSCRHSGCNENWRTTNQYPVRLLNICTGNLRLHEFYEGTFHEKYVTLSHCWRDDHPEDFSKLTRHNKPRWEAGIEEHLLPRKFRDAVEVARWIGVQYLWIDALCIIQDSDSDWQTQSSVMGDIYTGSFCNIAATSESCDGGFLRQRRSEAMEPCLIPHPERASSDKTHIIGYDDFWCNNLLSTPLHKRAWVLQERVMSPRTIHFGEQLFWECREHKACESYPTGIPEEFCNDRTKAWRQSEFLLNPESKLRPKHSLLTWIPKLWPCAQKRKTQGPLFTMDQVDLCWSHLVEQYMECQLTYASDKLVAIQGLANKIRSCTGVRYLAGLWDNEDLVPSLLWYSPSRKQCNGMASIKHRHEKYEYRAPAWSWASVDGTIVWKLPAQYGSRLLRVEKTILRSPESVGRSVTQAGEMHVSGNLLDVQIRLIPDGRGVGSGDEEAYEVLRNCKTTDNGQHRAMASVLSASTPMILLDKQMAPTREIDAQLLPVLTNWHGRPSGPPADIAGLILSRERCDTEWVYKRIGVFCFDCILADRTVRERNLNVLQAAFAQGKTEPITLI